MQFENVSKVYSVAQFFMEILEMQYFTYIHFVEQLSARINQTDYIKILASILSKIRLIDLRDTLIFIDEYTVINKSLLFVLLIIFKHYKIGCIISGDRNQLQTINDSKNTKTLTSFDVVSLFADRIFTFTKNERCENSDYNDIIRLVSRYSSNKKLDPFGYCLITAAMFNNMCGIPKFTDTFLASTHRSLAITQHVMTTMSNNEIQTSFYILDKSIKQGNRTIQMIDNDGKIIPSMRYPENVTKYITWATQVHEKLANCSIVQRTASFPFKFLPYLPLKINCLYYVFEFSESCIGRLVGMDTDNKILTLSMLDSGKIVQVRPSSKFEHVIFDEHLKWLKTSTSDEPELGALGKILNYPIYPARFMTIHRCQGCTITDSINIDLCDSNYQALYVAISRVKNRNQIVSIKIPKQLIYSLTTIVNFKEYCDNKVVLTGACIESRLKTNYHMYTPQIAYCDFYMRLVSRFIQEPDNRTLLREEIIKYLPTRTISEIVIPPTVNSDYTNNEDNEGVIAHIMKHLDYYKLLSCWNDQDRLYWIHEFMRISDEFRADYIGTTTTATTTTTTTKSQATYVNIESQKMLLEVTKLFSIPLSQSSLEFIRRNCNISSEENECTVRPFASGFVQAPTLFQKHLFMKLENNESITREWLIDMLYTTYEFNENDDCIQTMNDINRISNLNDQKNSWKRSSTCDVISEVSVFKRKRLRPQTPSTTN